MMNASFVTLVSAQCCKKKKRKKERFICNQELCDDVQECCIFCKVFHHDDEKNAMFVTGYWYWFVARCFVTMMMML